MITIRAVIVADEILYLRIRSTYIDEQIYEVVLTWVYRLAKVFPKKRKREKERERFTRFRSKKKAEKIERREALFCLREETRFEETGLSSVCLLETYSLLTSLATCHLVVYFSCPGPLSILFALASTKYEGRFARVLCVKTRYHIGDASTTSATTSLLYRFCLPFRCRSVAREDVFDTCWKFPSFKILFTLRLYVEMHINTINPFARDGVKIIRIELLVL